METEKKTAFGQHFLLFLPSKIVSVMESNMTVNGWKTLFDNITNIHLVLGMIAQKEIFIICSMFRS